MEGRKVVVGVGGVILALVGVALAVTAVVSPNWGVFSNAHIKGKYKRAINDKRYSNEQYYVYDYYAVNRGHFGPWEICVEQENDRVDCGEQYTQFRPSGWTTAAGVVASIGLGFCVFTLLVAGLPLAMLRAREKVCLDFKAAIITKLVLCSLAMMSAIIATAVYSREPERNPLGYKVTRGYVFFLELALILVELLVLLCTIWELIWALRPGGNPVKKKRLYIGPGPSACDFGPLLHPKQMTYDDANLQRMRKVYSSTENVIGYKNLDMYKTTDIPIRYQAIQRATDDKNTLRGERTQQYLHRNSAHFAINHPLQRNSSTRKSRSCEQLDDSKKPHQEAVGRSAYDLQCLLNSGPQNNQQTTGFQQTHPKGSHLQENPRYQAKQAKSQRDTHRNESSVPQNRNIGRETRQLSRSTDILSSQPKPKSPGVTRKMKRGVSVSSIGDFVLDFDYKDKRANSGSRERMCTVGRHGHSPVPFRKSVLRAAKSMDDMVSTRRNDKRNQADNAFNIKKSVPLDSVRKSDKSLTYPYPEKDEKPVTKPTPKPRESISGKPPELQGKQSQYSSRKSRVSEMPQLEMSGRPEDRLNMQGYHSPEIEHLSKDYQKPEISSFSKKYQAPVIDQLSKGYQSSETESISKMYQSPEISQSLKDNQPPETFQSPKKFRPSKNNLPQKVNETSVLGETSNENQKPPKKHSVPKTFEAKITYEPSKTYQKTQNKEVNDSHAKEPIKNNVASQMTMDSYSQTPKEKIYFGTDADKKVMEVSFDNQNNKGYESYNEGSVDRWQAYPTSDLDSSISDSTISRRDPTSDYDSQDSTRMSKREYLLKHQGKGSSRPTRGSISSFNSYESDTDNIRPRSKFNQFVGKPRQINAQVLPLDISDSAVITDL